MFLRNNEDPVLPYLIQKFLACLTNFESLSLVMEFSVEIELVTFFY